MNFTEILKYQEVDAKLYRLEMDIQNSKDRKLALEARDILKSAETQLKEMEQKSADYKKQYDTLNAQFIEKQKSVSESKKNAEKAANEEEISKAIASLNSLSRELQSLSSQLFNLIKQMDELSKSYVELGKKIKQAREAYDKGKTKLNELKASKEGEKQELIAKLEELKKNVEKDVMEKYLKLRGESIMPVITTSDDSHCHACGMTISQIKIEELNGKGYVECESCRRIIIK